jgi:hypothetical protein
LIGLLDLFSLFCCCHFLQILLLDDDDEVTPDGDHQHHESKQSAPTFAPDLDDIVRSQAVYFNATPAANKEQDKEIPDAFSFDDDTPATPVVVKPMFSRSPTSVNGKRGAEKSDVAKVESEKSDLEKSDQKSDASSFVAETRAIVAALAPSAVVASVTEAAKSVTSPIKHAVVNPASRGVSFANVPSNVSLSTLPPSPTIKPVTVEMSVDSSVNVSTTEKSKQERLEAARSAALATKQRILAEKAAAAAAKQ